MTVRRGPRRAALAGLVALAAGGAAATARWVPVPGVFVAAMLALGLLEGVVTRWPAGRGPAMRLAFLAAWIAVSSWAYGGFVAPSAAGAVQSACVALLALVVGLAATPRGRRGGTATRGARLERHGA